MYKAIIDLGTNTFHLMIASIKEGVLDIRHKQQIAVKIGEKGINSGFIGDEAYLRGMNALGQFRLKLDELNIGNVLAFGTSAIRDAKNGNQFIAEAKQKFNIEIQAISGDKEALYIYEGVKHSFDFPDKTLLVMDIGGGSVEFIIGKRDTVFWKKSYPIGAARLIELYQRHDPMSEAEQDELRLFISSTLKDLFEAIRLYDVKMLVGSAGSFETLRDVIVQHFNATVKMITSNACIVSAKDFELFYQLMIRTDEANRRQIKGLIDFRVDMIVVSAILMDVMVQQLSIAEIVVSDNALKEGMFFRMNS